MEIEVSSTVMEVGGSLPVENVQELASTNLKYIPDRYVRPEIELDEISNDLSLHIPVIDMTKLAADHLCYEDELDKLHQACKQWGFFQLINHGATEVIDKMKVVVSDFFKLPLEQKTEYAQLPNSIEGYGQAFVLSEDQKLDWGDMLFLLLLPVSQRNMRFWPSNPTSLRSTLEEYSSELKKVAMSLLNLMAINLGVDSKPFSSMYEDCTQAIRMNYYPSCVQADKVIGLTPHSDALALTLLAQVNDVRGLQIKKNDKWGPINPIPGAIIANVGDAIEIESNGEYRSIEHRAVVNFHKERLSIAAFHGPNLGTKIGPLPELVNTSNAANYKTVEYWEYLRFIASNKLDGKSLLDQMKINQAQISTMETEAISKVMEVGGSLAVDNVQELASNMLNDIPDRYVQTEIGLDEISTDPSLHIPVIDMIKLAADHLGYEGEMAKLHQACKQWGFFQLINHGATEAIEKMKVVVSEFFKLPSEQKMAYAQLPNSVEGYGHAFVLSEDQKLDWGDMLFLLSLPVSQRNMRFWPKSPTSFRSTLEEYSSELKKIAMSLLNLIAINLGADTKTFISMYEDCTQMMRVNYYPHCVQANKVTGLSPHSDAVGLTLLVQVNDVQGLQVKKNDKWVNINPVPGAIIVNIGDIIEIESNGAYRSIEHRAVVDFQKERISIAAFHSPNPRMKIGPLPDFVNATNGANYKTVGYEEYLRLINSRKLDGKNRLDLMKLNQQNEYCHSQEI